MSQTPISPDPTSPDPTSPAPPPAPPASTLSHELAAPAPLATSVSLLLPLAIVVVFLLFVGGGAAALARWWLFDAAGSLWLVQRLPLVQVQGFQGALLGESWLAERVELRWGKDEESVTIEGLASSGMRWTWKPNEHALLGLDIGQIGARKVTVHTGKPGPRPIPLPASVVMPLQLTIQQARVDELQVDALAPVLRLTAQGLVLETRPGALHRIEAAQGEWQGLHLEASASIGNISPLPLMIKGTLRPSADGDAPRWAAVLQAAGPLPDVQLSGTLRGVPLAGREMPALDLQALLHPLQAWPLSTLNVQTRALDLSALSVRAPQTRLSGSATLTGTAKDAPLTATLALDNAQPGRWNERRLPIKRLVAELRGSLSQPGSLDVQRFEAALADATRSAGHIRGKAAWSDHELKLEVQLQSVVPQRLDGRAAALQLSGPVLVTLRGLPSPDRAATTTPPPPSMSWKVDLEGKLDAARQAVKLAMEGSANDQRLEVTRLHASSGNATADLRAVLQQAGKNDWRLESAGSLVDFDPQPWWPGESGSAWRQGPHRLSAGWQFDLRAPANAAALPTIELLQRLVGTGNLRVHDSMLAGVPLSADVKLGYARAAAPAPALLVAEFNLGGNLLTLEGRGDPASNGQADRWRAELKAESLRSLAPLTRLHPALADWVPRQGSASLTLAGEGRWPNLRTEGTARAAQLQVGTLAVAQAQANWRLDTGGERALVLQLELAGLALGAQRADHLRANVSGTLADHRIDINGALPLLPPQAAVTLLGVQAQSGTRAQLLAQGSWQADAAGGGRWRAQVERAVVGSWDGSAASGPPASQWAQARDVRAELQFDGTGKLVALQADPGQLQLADNVTLRWDEVKVDLRGALARMELRADIEPFALAPLLARLQPTLGWSGDIRLGARVEIRAGERFDADVVFERRDGDLHFANPEGTQLLGLTELRLALTAHDGAWTFVPVLKGRSLGEITGSVRVQTTPERRWPHADAAISGDVQARVADLGIWGAWVPAGWHLGGELRTTATLSGRFAEPRYTGAITGTGLAVRNLLQGVNVSDGQIAVRLEGDKASIERFTLKGGDGTLTITGDATLGAVPQARLQVKAERFRVVGRVDRLAIASGQAELLLASEQTRLEGRFTLDEGLFDTSGRDTPSLDDDVTVRRPGERAAAADDQRPTNPRRNLVLALELDLGQKTRVRGRGLDTGLGGSVRLATPGGRLDVRGTIRADEGTYAAYGQKLTLERGSVAFSGPPDDPRLDILALRPNIDTRVGVLITGTLQSPRVRLYSEPDMSDTEKLSWLVLGRASDGLGRTDTALLQRAAVALLSGEGEAPTDALLKSLGIDELGLRQSEGDVRETVIILGKQLSRRWYLGYERGVNSTTGTWQLIYRIAQRFTLRAQSGLENSLDVIWSWRLQETPADASMRKSIIVPP